MESCGCIKHMDCSVGELPAAGAAMPVCIAAALHSDIGFQTQQGLTR